MAGGWGCFSCAEGRLDVRADSRGVRIAEHAGHVLAMTSERCRVLSDDWNGAPIWRSACICGLMAYLLVCRTPLRTSVGRTESPSNKKEIREEAGL
jgi:hypothetical protein